MRRPAALSPTSAKEYLSWYGGRWYLSPPPTQLVWNWSSGQQLTGTYTYYEGTAVLIYDCAGSDEQPWWGIGCSDGSGGTFKTLTIYDEYPSAAQGTVCPTHSAWAPAPSRPSTSALAFADVAVICARSLGEGGTAPRAARGSGSRSSRRAWPLAV